MQYASDLGVSDADGTTAGRQNTMHPFSVRVVMILIVGAILGGSVWFALEPPRPVLPGLLTTAAFVFIGLAITIEKKHRGHFSEKK